MQNNNHPALPQTNIHSYLSAE